MATLTTRPLILVVGKPEVDPHCTEGKMVVYRGGAFTSPADYLRSAARVYAGDGANFHSRSLGFRVVREIEQDEDQDK